MSSIGSGTAPSPCYLSPSTSNCCERRSTTS
uniref:Uncharacterized protein n=1 Tax=Arundo donax TaxID=35708 RepID=A0A0A9F666_ARUDO